MSRFDGRRVLADDPASFGRPFLETITVEAPRELPTFSFEPPPFNPPVPRDVGGSGGGGGQLLEGELVQSDTQADRALRAFEQATPEQRAALIEGAENIDELARTDARVTMLRAIEARGTSGQLDAFQQIRRVLGRDYAEDALAWATQQLAGRVALPEVLVSAGRVAGGWPFAIATGVLEGALALGSYLSGRALELATARLGDAEPPPGSGGAVGEPEGPFGQPEVAVTAPRPPAAPDLSPFSPPWSAFQPDLGSPVAFGAPEATVPIPRPATIPDFESAPFEFQPVSPLALPPPLPAIGLPGLEIGPEASRPTNPPAPSPLQPAQPGAALFPTPTSLLLTPFQPPGVDSPSKRKRCDCPKPKRRKRKPRDECYRGTYIERANGLTKFRKEKIPCQPSKSKSASPPAPRIRTSSAAALSSFPALGRSFRWA